MAVNPTVAQIAAVLRRGDRKLWLDPEDAREMAEDLHKFLGIPAPAPAHEFVGTVKRADGIIVTATLTVPGTHPMAQPGPHRPWHGAQQSNQNFLELGELVMMIAQQGYGIIERNERSRENWGKQDYWADLLNVEPPTAAICGPGTAQQAAPSTPTENITEKEAHRG